MRFDDLDFNCYICIKFCCIAVLALLILCHFVPNSLEIHQEISYGKDRGNIACVAMMLLIIPLSLAPSLRLYDRGYHLFSFLISWIIPLSLVMIPTKYNDKSHIFSSLYVFVLITFTCWFFINNSKYSRFIKLKMLFIGVAILTLFTGFGIAERLLIIEGCISVLALNEIL